MNVAGARIDLGHVDVQSIKTQEHGAIRIAERRLPELEVETDGRELEIELKW